MKRITELMLAAVLLLSFTKAPVYAKSFEGPEEIAVQETAEESAPAPEEARANEEPAPAPVEDRVIEKSAPAPEEARANEETAPSAEEAQTIEETAPSAEEARTIEETAPSAEEAQMIEGSAPASEENASGEAQTFAPETDTDTETEPETEETPLITLNTSEEGEPVDQCDVRISWSVTEGDLSLQSVYTWDPEELRYEKCGEDLAVNTAPGVEITIRNDSDCQISYVIEPRFIGDFGDQPQKITGTVDAGASEVISSSLKITRIPDGYDGSEQIAAYQISIYRQKE